MPLMISPDPLLASRTASVGKLGWLGWALLSIVLTLLAWGALTAHKAPRSSEHVKWDAIVGFHHEGVVDGHAGHGVDAGFVEATRSPPSGRRRL